MKRINRIYEAKTLTPPKDRGPVITVPGQATNLKQLLAQHSRGMPLPTSTEGQYFGDIDVPDFESMDLVDIADYTRDLQNHTKELQADLARYQKVQQKAAEAAKAAQTADPQPVTPPKAE